MIINKKMKLLFIILITIIILSLLVIEQAHIQNDMFFIGYVDRNINKYLFMGYPLFIVNKDSMKYNELIDNDEFVKKKLIEHISGTINSGIKKVFNRTKQIIKSDIPLYEIYKLSENICGIINNVNPLIENVKKKQLFVDKHLKNKLFIVIEDKLYAK